MEILAVQAQPPRVICLDRQGQALWAVDLPAAPAASPAISHNGLLAVSIDRRLMCLDPATGRHRWEKDVAGTTPYPPVWADLNFDDVDELLLPASIGLLAIDAEGNSLWRYPEDPGESLKLRAPLVAMDAEQDGKSEVFLLTDDSLVCIEGDGFVRWQATIEAVGKDAHLIGADLNEDGLGEIYAAMGDRIIAYDAAFGDEIASRTFDAPVTLLAATNLDRDGQGELVAALASGAIGVYHMDGDVHVFKQQAIAPSVLLAADVNGDTEIDLVVPGRDSVEILGSAAKTFPAPSPLGAAVADLDGDGTLELLATRESGISAWNLGAPLWPAFQHWPQFRNDAAQRGAWKPMNLPRSPAVRLSTYAPVDTVKPELRLIQSNEQLLRAGSFDDPSWQEDWTVENDAEVFTLDPEGPASGNAALRIEPRGHAVLLQSRAIPVTPQLRSVSAGILVRGEASIEAKLVWQRNGEEAGEKVLSPLAVSLPGGWTRYGLSGVAVARFPAAEYEMRLTIAIPPANTPVWLDEAQVNGSLELIPVGQVYANQVAYELVAPKSFTVRCNFDPRDAVFTVLNMEGLAVHRGRFLPAERITGAFENDWGSYFLRGDFSAWDEEGRYRIEANLDGLRLTSLPFEIQFNGIWEQTIDSAVVFFRNRRPPQDAGETALWIPGENDADPVSVAWELVRSYDVAAVQLRKRTPEGAQPLLLDEILWAGNRLLARWQSDEQPAPPALYAAIFARLLRITGSAETWRAAAEEALVAANTQDAMQELRFGAALDLYLSTRDDSFAELAHTLYPGASILIPESIAYYDGEFENLATFQLAGHFAADANAWLKRARSPFGVCTQGDKGGNFFGTPANADDLLWGNSAYVLEGAAAVARAYRFNPRPEYLAFMHDQFNWILGNNPMGISLMAGQGTKQPSSFAATPVEGGIVNGIRGHAPAVDVPAFDEEPDPRSNGFSLRNNAAWISALANLKRIPTAEIQ
jgi:outer membrane protein assembly factor BamB